MATISERIQEAMRIRNLRQADLVEMTGIGKSSISTYISGEYEPKQKNIYLIAKALNVSEAWLMGLDVPMEKNKATALGGDDLTEKQRKYLEKIEQLSDEQLKLLDIFMNGLNNSTDQ